MKTGYIGYVAIIAIASSDEIAWLAVSKLNDLSCITEKYKKGI